MKLKYIYFFLLFNFIKLATYEYNFTVSSSINDGNIFYDHYDLYDSQYRNCDFGLKIIFPERDYSDFYLIFDYYIQRGDSSDLSIQIFDNIYYGIRNKLAIKVTTKSEFSLYIYFKKDYSSSFYFNFVFGYANYPFFYYGTNSNFSTKYCYNDDFRMVLDISEFKEKKDYYFNQSFDYEKKPYYKLFESFDLAVNFDFKNFDGNLNIDDNKIIYFKKPNKKYNYVVLYFKGKYKNKNQLSDAFFAILKNYEIKNFNPIIPIVIYVITVFIVISLFYYMFQYEKKTQIKKEISRKLFEK